MPRVRFRKREGERVSERRATQATGAALARRNEELPSKEDRHARCGFGCGPKRRQRATCVVYRRESSCSSRARARARYRCTTRPRSVLCTASCSSSVSSGFGRDGQRAKGELSWQEAAVRSWANTPVPKAAAGKRLARAAEHSERAVQQRASPETHRRP